MKYKFITPLSINEIIDAVKKSVDVKFIDILLGTGNMMAILKKENKIIFITKTKRAFKKNFHCTLNELDDGTIISGYFKINVLIKLLYTISLIVTIGIITFLLTPFTGMNLNDRLFFGIVLIFFLLIEIFLYKLRKIIGIKDKRIIIQYLKEALKAKDS